jgi:hypothetical protein
LWLALLAGLGVRGIVADDARYAWGMFPYILRYEVEYRWRMDDGGTRPFQPGREIRRARAVYAPGKEHDRWYGLGALRVDLRAYARLVATRARPAPPAGARAFEIVLTWRKHEDGARHEEVIAAPVKPRAEMGAGT